MFKNFFIPNASNTYSPYLLRQKILIIYLIILLIFNFVLGDKFFIKAKASVDFTTLYQLHNEQRKKYGLKELDISIDLNNSANNKAAAMLQTNCWSHFCPNGKSPWDYFDEVGYNYIYAGENLAEGFDDNEDVMNAWINSTTHRDNILNSHFEEIGMGFAYGNFQGIENNTIIVVHFGSKNLSELITDNAVNNNNSSQDSQVKINSPINGSHLNDPRFTVQGNAPEDSTVSVLANSQELGRVQASGSNFTVKSAQNLKDEKYTLNAEAYDNFGNILGTAEPVSVEVDTKAPAIDTNSLTINTLAFANDKLTFKLKVSENLQTLSANLSLYSSSKVDQDIWTVEILRSELEKITSITLTAKDLAGNTGQATIASGIILAQAEIMERKLLGGEENTFLTNIGIFFNNVLPQNTKEQLNLIFVIFLILLFAIDFYVLSATGLTGMNRSRSHYHLPIFIILILLIIFGSAAGNILTGSNT